MKPQYTQTQGHNESMHKRKTHSSECRQKKTRESIQQQLDSTPKSTRTKGSKFPKRSRRQEIIKLRAEMKQVETKRTIQRINQTRSWFFEKIKKIDIPLGRLKRGHRVSILINKTRNEKRDITTETQEPPPKKKLSDPTIRAYT